MKKKIHSQPRIKGVKRVPTSNSLIPEVEEKLTQLANRYGVSRSWVQATILADGLSIGKQVPYYEMSKLRRVK